jgi:hypothetical protein
MRIPTSVIVMTLVTAAPFALAVRDTLHPQPTHHAYEDELDVSAEAETARYEAEMARQEAERQAEEARKQTVLKGLLGEPGKLGSYLDYLTLGATRGQVDAIDARLQSASDLIYLVTEYDDADKLVSLKVVFNDCGALRDTVREAWGEGNRWVDAAMHVKATFDDNDNCAIELHRYVEMEQFLDKAPTASIPLGAIGKPSTVPLEADGTRIAPGLENTSDVDLRATVDDNDRLVGLTVSFSADVEADQPIRARLTKLLGKGTQDPDTGEWVWKGKSPVHYVFTDGHVYIDIGEP